MVDRKAILMGYARPLRKSPGELARIRRRAEIATDGIVRLKAIHEGLEHSAALMEEAVKMARDEDATWDEIGEALGISKQAAAKRFGRRYHR